MSEAQVSERLRTLMAAGVKPAAKTAKLRTPLLLNEAPEVIGMMTVVVGNGGSLDQAVRDVAANGPKLSAGLFKAVVDDADTRVEADMRLALTRLISSLPPGTAGYRMALHMVVSAADAPDRDERERMLREASDIALTGLKEAGKRYSASLNAPCMTIFALGIMVPMVMMSILPMLSIGGLFGPMPFSLGEIMGLTLVIVPAAVAAVIVSIKNQNPFLATGKPDRDLRPALPLLVAGPAAVAFWMIGLDSAAAACLGLTAGGLLCAAAVYRPYMEEKEREKQAQIFEDAVFEMGNRLISGDSFEDAMVRSLALRGECAELAESLRRELDICRGNVPAAIRRVLAPASPAVAEMVCGIQRAAVKDLRDAGRLALTVGRQLQDQEAVRRSIRSDLKGMTDTMFGTASVFAPLVLGMSVAMLTPLARISSEVDFSGTALILTVYLAELSVLMAALMSFLDGRTGIRDVVWRFALMLPVAMLVFAVCMRIAF
ncbi:MAG: hypothetical protein WCQ63_01725 [Methanomethylophilus sp.]|nr:hypothetical protein [Methanomethylophilus sp.]MDD4222636.1 hypothetical protein [Methanomethylophilus sp.]MDD4669146.1 hypothetical protein [Methanomethylophilus sp.]